MNAVVFWGCAGNSSRKNPNYFDSDPASDAIRTAQIIIGFDYRKNRERARTKEVVALHAMFLFTDSEAFIGAGADQHCSVLQDLLRLWGDRSYARELAKEPPKVRAAVISALDYENDPDWKSQKFPSTFALAKHDEISFGSWHSFPNSIWEHTCPGSSIASQGTYLGGRYLSPAKWSSPGDYVPKGSSRTRVN